MIKNNFAKRTSNLLTKSSIDNEVKRVHRSSFRLNFGVTRHRNFILLIAMDNSPTKDEFNERQPLLGHEIREVKVNIKYNLEVSLMLVFFGWNLSQTIIPNQLLKQTCLLKGYEAEECMKLDVGNASKEIEEQIQPYVAKILMTMTVLSTFVPGLMSLFLGPWTDKFGRKKVICATLLGYTFSLVLLVIISTISDHQKMTNPWIFVITLIPTIITGSTPSLSVAVMCYISDNTAESDRSFRLILIDIIGYVGIMTGILSSSFILKLTSATTIFKISTLCAALALIYAICFVHESDIFHNNENMRRQIRELFSFVAIRLMVETCLKRRALNGRRIVWSLIIVLMLFGFTVQGTSTVFYLFVREKFQWNLKDANLFQMSAFTISLVGGFIGVLTLKKLLKLSDISLAALSNFSTFIDLILKSVAQTGTQMYFAVGVGLFGMLKTSMCRSIIASVVPSSEIGKVYSMTSLFETTFSIIAPPLYTLVYSLTFTYFAGAFYILTAFVNLICLGLIYYVFKLSQSQINLIAHTD